MDDTKHRGQVIPVPEKRSYAYQSEISYPMASILSHPSFRDQSDEARMYDEYMLTIHKHTDTSFVVTLHKRRKDIVQQRKINGAAVTEDIYQRIMDFAELCNLIFSPGCDHFTEEERFPEAIREAMKKVYG